MSFLRTYFDTVMKTICAILIMAPVSCLIYGFMFWTWAPFIELYQLFAFRELWFGGTRLIMFVAFFVTLEKTDKKNKPEQVVDQRTGLLRDYCDMLDG